MIDSGICYPYTDYAINSAYWITENMSQKAF